MVSFTQKSRDADVTFLQFTIVTFAVVPQNDYPSRLRPNFQHRVETSFALGYLRRILDGALISCFNRFRGRTVKRMLDGHRFNLSAAI